MHLVDDISVRVLKPGEPVVFDIAKAKYGGQLKPVEIFILPEGSIDNKPSYAFRMIDAHGYEYIAQITNTMLTEALNRVKAL